MKKAIFLVCCCAWVTGLSAQVSETCFSELEGLKGTQILQALHTKIKDHTVLSYDDVRADRAGVDINELKNTIRDMYSSCTFGLSDYCGQEGYSEECDCYNREHSLPKSWWDHRDKYPEPMYSDLHHVIPTDAYSNGQRGTIPYGNVTGTVSWSNALGSKVGYSSALGTKVFEPVDQYKGDIARIYFYMITCYYNKAFNRHKDGQKIFTYSSGKAGFTSAALAILLDWHRADKVSGKERNRNNAVEQLQGNRNPFVDAPELVEYIWGDKKTEVYSCSTAIETVEQPAPRATKRIINGQLYLMYNGTMYNVQGNRVQSTK